MYFKINIEAIETYLLSVLSEEKKGKWPTFLKYFLHLLSWIFSGLVQIRIWLYKHRLLRENTLGCQVISVGNLTVGGTGKTPVVEVFARQLCKQGRKVAILSRGYKSRSVPFWEKMWQRISNRSIEIPPKIVSDGKSLLLDSHSAGDEPYMLASNLPDVVVIVDKDRVKAGKYAIQKYGCDTLILDDGYQYLKLSNRLDIALVDRTNPYGGGYLLPRGLLREPIRNLKRAGFIFITKCDKIDNKILKNQLRKLNPNAEISECRHEAKYLKEIFGDDQFVLEKLEGMNIVSLSAIAVPESFENALKSFGANIVHNNRFADHHRYTQQEIINIINHAVKLGADAIVTTEKDAVRFPFIERIDIPLLYMRVEIEMITGEEEFISWIDRICFKSSKIN